MKKETMKTNVVTIALGLGLFSGAAIAKPGERSMQNADADGDGFVSQEEFLAKAQERFNNIDANGDGFISQEEGQAAKKEVRGRRKEGGKKDPAKLFTDRNEDGVITVEDVPERAARIFKRVDTDENGEISEEEKQAFLDHVAERREGGKKGRDGRRRGRGGKRR